MKKICNLIKKHTDILLIVLAGIFILAGVLSYVLGSRNPISYSFTEEEIAAVNPENTGSVVTIGGYIDASYNTGEWDVVQNLALTPGYYEYTVDYICDGAAESAFKIDSYEETYEAVGTKTAAYVSCADGEHSSSSGVWINMKLNDAALRVSYVGTGTIKITGFCISETDRLPRQHLTVLILIAVILLLMAYPVKIIVSFFSEKSSLFKSSAEECSVVNRRIFIVAGLILLCFMSSFLSFYAWTIKGHDLGFHLARIQGVAEGLMEGQFPVRINTVFLNGYGYADTVMYGNLLLYVPALLFIGGISITTAYNIFVVLINILTVSVSYYSFKNMFRNEKIGLFATALYALAPYRIVNIYLRAAVGEYSAMIFLPLIIYGMYRIYSEDPADRKNRFNYIPLVIGLSGVIESHILSTEMVGGVIILSCLILIKKTLKPKRLLKLIKTVGMTLLVNLWFIVPFVDYYINMDTQVKMYGSSGMLQTKGLYFIQLFELFPHYNWDTYDAGAGVVGDAPMTLGFGMGICLVLFVLALILRKSNQAEAVSDGNNQVNYLKGIKAAGIVSFILAIFTIFLTTEIFPWDRIHNMLPFGKAVLKSIQFPWRFLSLASALVCVVGAVSVLLIKNKFSVKAATVCAAVLVALNGLTVAYFMQEAMENQSIIWKVTELSDFGEDTVWLVSGGEYTPVTFDRYTTARDTSPETTENCEIVSFSKNGTHIEMNVVNSNSESALVSLPLVNYKGYTASDDTGAISGDSLTGDDKDRVAVVIPAGYSGTIKVWFAGFRYWRVAEIVSVLAIGGFIFLYLHHRKKCKI